MKIGVVSDTHLSHPDPALTGLLSGPLREAEVILHAGDITELGVLESLDGKEVLAVCGNMDSPALRRELPPKRTFQAGTFKIGIIHGWGGPQGIEERIRREFDWVDCIVFGHTHHPLQAWREGILFFNPGAFTGYTHRGQRSVGLLEVGEKISGQIIYL